MTRLILQVSQLPTYSPDYNPIEKLWKKIKQQDTHLHYFPTFEALTEKVEQALLKFANIPEEILALCSLPTALADDLPPYNASSRYVRVNTYRQEAR
jgi:hypothetical protein